MGGSSGPPGGGYVPRVPPARPGAGGGEGGQGGDPCSFSLITTLASPDSAVIAKLRPGYTLRLVLVSSDDTTIVQAQADDGGVAGTIAGIPNLRALIGCMQIGIDYVFKVRTITGGRVDGTLRNAK